MQIDKRGFISVQSTNKIVCNRMGLTPEMIVNYGDYIQINTKNTYTVSKMSPGIILSFFSIDLKEMSPIPDSISDLIWFQENDRAYFLSTLNKIDGWKVFWKGYAPFGEILSKKYLMSLNPKYAWTFFLHNKPLMKKPEYTLSLLWDIDNQIFITPDKWPEYLNPDWKKKTLKEDIFNIGSNTSQIFKCNNSELQYLSATTKFSQYTFSFPNWIQFKYDNQSCKSITQRVISVSKNDGISVELGVPLLVTIYNGDQIFTCKIIIKDDVQIRIISNRSHDKYEALLIAMFRNENTSYFENKYFTADELLQFDEKLKNGKRLFYKQIFEKVVMKKYIQFPDKLYNTIQLGEILSANMTCTVKQEKAWLYLTECRGWKTCAISAFYSHYVK